jgi:hypothetical protein
MIRRCNEDAWSVDLIRCITEADKQAAMEACQTKLTPEQKKKLEDSMQAVAATAFQTSTGPTGPTPPTPLPPPVITPPPPPIALPECDAFRAALVRASACSTLSAADRSWVAQQSGSIAVTRPDEHSGPFCRDGLDRVQRVMSDAKCK